ncbi:unnamed protein product [Periconia digitata]|uniref:Translation initiation factor eIF4e n=1 Tax=Periconia digitata TaxID=1303443 RepID=A0A9W4XQT7_9PLEO|nr:unnamed protein product [Periconia digitata]
MRLKPGRPPLLLTTLHPLLHHRVPYSSVEQGLFDRPLHRLRSFFASKRPSVSPTTGCTEIIAGVTLSIHSNRNRSNAFYYVSSNFKSPYEVPIRPVDFESSTNFAAYKRNSHSLSQHTDHQSIPSSLLEALQKAIRGEIQPRTPTQPLSSTVELGISGLVSRLNKAFPLDHHTRVAPTPAQPEESTVINCQRIFAAADNLAELKAIAIQLDIQIAKIVKPQTDTMAGRLPALSTSDLPPASVQEAATTASPARGSAMLNNIFKQVRVPEFRFKWQFWAEKGQQATPAVKSATAGAEEYASRPKQLGDPIISIKGFYEHFNNIPIDNLKLRDSIHLFHTGVKPLWEDPRNTRGGAWYFRISKENAAAFWHEICLLAVGDVLQHAVETKRDAFNDDICGVTYSVRWNAVQVAVWTRDASNEAGKEKLLETILEKLSSELVPKKDACWYKAHAAHKGFAAPS